MVTKAARFGRVDVAQDQASIQRHPRHRPIERHGPRHSGRRPGSSLYILRKLAKSEAWGETHDGRLGRISVVMERP